MPGTGSRRRPRSTQRPDRQPNRQPDWQPDRQPDGQPDDADLPKRLARPDQPQAGGRPTVPGHDEDHLGDPEAVARTLCLRQLDVRARSRVELERYLAGKGVPDEAAGRVLDRFVELGLIDDRALAEAFVEAGHTYQGLARRGLAVKLRRRGVDDAVVAEAVEAIDNDQEEQAARALVQRRLRSLSGLDRPVQVRRLVGLLARKGYPAGLAYRVVRDVLAEVAPEVENLASASASTPAVFPARAPWSAGDDDAVDRALSDLAVDGSA